MKSTSLVLGALLAGAACAGPHAAAQTIERSVPISAIDDGAGGFNAYFGDGFAAAQSGRSFIDVFTFDVAGLPFDAAASVTSSTLNSPSDKDLRITALSLYRYDPATMAIIGPAISGIDQTGFGADAPDSWALTAYSLPAGAYAVRVDGAVRGGAGRRRRQLRRRPDGVAGAGSARLRAAAGRAGLRRAGAAPHDCGGLEKPPCGWLRQGGPGVARAPQGARRYRRKRSSRSDARRPSHSSVAPRVPQRRARSRSSRVLTRSCSST